MATQEEVDHIENMQRQAEIDAKAACGMLSMIVEEDKKIG